MKSLVRKMVRSSLTKMGFGSRIHCRHALGFLGALGASVTGALVVETLTAGPLW